MTQWVKVPYDGNPMIKTYIALIEDGNPTARDWKPAFFEGGELMVRSPGPGHFWLWTRVDDQVIKHPSLVRIT